MAERFRFPDWLTQVVMLGDGDIFPLLNANKSKLDFCLQQQPLTFVRNVPKIGIYCCGK